MWVKIQSSYGENCKYALIDSKQVICLEEDTDYDFEDGVPCIKIITSTGNNLYAYDKSLSELVEIVCSPSNIKVKGGSI